MWICKVCSSGFDKFVILGYWDIYMYMYLGGWVIFQTFKRLVDSCISGVVFYPHSSPALLKRAPGLSESGMEISKTAISSAPIYCTKLT